MSRTALIVLLVVFLVSLAIVSTVYAAVCPGGPGPTCIELRVLNPPNPNNTPTFTDGATVQTWPTPGVPGCLPDVTPNWAGPLIRVDTKAPIAPPIQLCYTATDVVAPQLSLTKTVGTVAGICSATKQIQVAQGTQVTYCYEITNTGTITLTSHTLVDDKLGVLLQNYPYILAPAAAAYITVNAVIDQDTINTAQWTATDGQASSTDTDTATVILLPEITMTKTVGTVAGVCSATKQIQVAQGTQVTYCYEITNTGTITLTSHTLVDDKLGVLLQNYPYTLAPAAAAYLTVNAVIDQDTINTAQWTATDGQASSTDSDTAMVILLPKIYLPFISR